MTCTKNYLLLIFFSFTTKYEKEIIKKDITDVRSAWQWNNDDSEVSLEERTLQLHFVFFLAKHEREGVLQRFFTHLHCQGQGTLKIATNKVQVNLFLIIYREDGTRHDRMAGDEALSSSFLSMLAFKHDMKRGFWLRSGVLSGPF